MRPSAVHRGRAERRRHVFEKRPLLFAVVGALRHRGGEVVDLPVRRDREVQRVGAPVDEHHAILAPRAVGAARVDVGDREQVRTGERFGDGAHLAGVLDQREVFAGMKTRAAQQHGPSEIQRRQQRGPVGRHQLAPRDAHDRRRHHARDRGESPSVRGAAGGAYRRGTVHDRRFAASERRFDDAERAFAAIRFTDRVEHDAVRRQRRGAGIRFGDEGGDFEDAVVEQMLDRDVAAGRRGEQQHAHRRRRAAVGRDLDGAVGERLAPGALGRLAMPAPLERRREPAVRFAQVGIEPQRVLEAAAGSRDLVVLEHHLAEPNVRGRVPGMPQGRLREEDAGRLRVARRDQQTAERHHRLAVRAVAREHVEVRALGVVAQPERLEQPGALEPEPDLRVLVGFELRVDGPQTLRLSQPPRSPRADGPRVLHEVGSYGRRLTTRWDRRLQGESADGPNAGLR